VRSARLSLGKRLDQGASNMKWIDGLRLRFEGRLVRALEKEVGKLTVELETARAMRDFG
jgi:hypothetical protein